MSKRKSLVIKEDMTIYHAEAQKPLLLEAVAKSAALELDLSQVSEIDTAGLQLLMLAKREAERLGKSVHIVAHSQAVRQTFEFCNLTVFFGDPIVITAREQK